MTVPPDNAFSVNKLSILYAPVRNSSFRQNLNDRCRIRRMEFFLPDEHRIKIMDCRIKALFPIHLRRQLSFSGWIEAGECLRLIKKSVPDFVRIIRIKAFYHCKDLLLIGIGRDPVHIDIRG